MTFSSPPHNTGVVSATKTTVDFRNAALKSCCHSLCRSASQHQFWVPAEVEEEVENKELLEQSKSRYISFPGRFVPVSHFCRAPLGSGKLCQRQDRLKVSARRRWRRESSWSCQGFSRVCLSSVSLPRPHHPPRRGGPTLQARRPAEGGAGGEEEEGAGAWWGPFFQLLRIPDFMVFISFTPTSDSFGLQMELLYPLFYWFFFHEASFCFWFIFFFVFCFHSLAFLEALKNSHNGLHKIYKNVIY